MRTAKNVTAQSLDSPQPPSPSRPAWTRLTGHPVRLRTYEYAHVRVYRATRPEHAQAVAIHLLQPTLAEIHDAVERALRDGFDLILLHSPKTWPFNPSKE